MTLTEEPFPGITLADYDNRARATVAGLRHQSEVEDNADQAAFYADLADNFEYLLDHTDEFENGDIDPDDLPAGDPADKWILFQSVVFGTLHPAATPPVYVLLGADDAFLAVYGAEENAAARAADAEPLHVKQVELTDRSPAPLIDSGKASDDSVIQRVAENFEALVENYDTFVEQEWSPDDLPHGDATLKLLNTWGAMFGIIWEGAHPELYVVTEGDDTFHGVYSRESTAEETVEECDNCVMFRALIADGEQTANQIRAFLP